MEWSSTKAGLRIICDGGSLLYFACMLDAIKADADAKVVGIDNSLTEKAEYERRWAWIFPAWFLSLELEVVKDDPRK